MISGGHRRPHAGWGSAFKARRLAEEQQAFGVAGDDIGIGAETLTRAALEDDFAAASGQYFDNDSGRFAPPHPDALDPRKCQEIQDVIETVLAGSRQRGS